MMPQKSESQSPEEIAKEIVPIGLQVSTGVVADLRDAIAAVIRSERENTDEALSNYNTVLDELVASIRELKAEREKCEAMREALDGKWQSIETAPRERTPILAFGLVAGEVGGPQGESCCATVYWNCGASDYEGFLWKVDNTDAYAAWMKPTHWQPLPPAPKEVKRCAYGDPFCPCQDGDTCHYEGSNAMRPKKAQS